MPSIQALEKDTTTARRTSSDAWKQKLSDMGADTAMADDLREATPIKKENVDYYSGIIQQLAAETARGVRKGRCRPAASGCAGRFFAPEKRGSHTILYMCRGIIRGVNDFGNTLRPNCNIRRPLDICQKARKIFAVLSIFAGQRIAAFFTAKETGVCSTTTELGHLLHRISRLSKQLISKKPDADRPYRAAGACAAVPVAMSGRSRAPARY
jgi:hypothetical protein